MISSACCANEDLLQFSRKTLDTNAIALGMKKIPDFNEVPKATPTLSGFSNTVGLVWILSDAKVTDTSKMAAYNRKYICNNEYFSLYK